jgi:hypothetical protein
MLNLPQVVACGRAQKVVSASQDGTIACLSVIPNLVEKGASIGGFNLLFEN